MNCFYLMGLLVSSSNFVLFVGKNEIYVFQLWDFRTGSFYELRPLIYQNMPDFSVLFSTFRVFFFVFYFAFYRRFFSTLCISVLPFSVFITPFLLSVFFSFSRVCLFYRPFSSFKKTLFTENIPVYCPFRSEHALHMSLLPKIIRRCFTL